MSPHMSFVKLNLDGLHTLQRQAEELGGLRAQVGLFQETAGRSVKRAGRIDNNPQLGSIHELGTSYSILSTGATVVIPARSFLNMPLTLKLGETLLTNAANWFKLLHTRGAKRTMQFLGVVGEEIVQEAFATRGFGFWPALRPRTIARKNSTAILIESVQFRKAISSRVV